MTAIHVAVVDNNRFVTDTIGEKLALDGANLTAVCLVERVDELIHALGQGVRVDVVLLDFFLSDGTRAIDNVDRILTAGISLLVISSEPRHHDVIALLQARPRVNFLSTSDLIADIPAAIQRTWNGDVVMKQTTLDEVRSTPRTPRPQLTRREEDVFRLWAMAMPPKSIAIRLGIREDTVRDHLPPIRRKFRDIGRPVDDPIERHWIAIEYGYIPSPRPQR
ncbi:response regulator transcription factor [Plantactinospora sp. S1510]|uniref:Response regulator transcription factor n=1 Tax=Plantactinospora alkalitolerans TaxID=2789879 RepID=A0ABS0GVQ1_9ACTN|nr:LuxR C-terminal-related transcriptional regulator [Plantactinospora alkalitolerans]MBF9130014.1 response regulator transcription factor [Plantactinospora alkalitolerans]